MRWSGTNPAVNRGHSQCRSNQSAREAIVEAHRSASTSLPIRIGLTGLMVNSGAATLATLVPCANISIAARQITQLSERCQAVPRLTANAIHCSIAAYHESWERPDNKFADDVLMSVAKGDAPDFEMPDAIDSRSDDVATEPPVSGQRFSAERSAAADDQLQAWSSALFPARSKQFDDASSNSSGADRRQASSAMSERPMTAPSHDDRLFVRRSPERRPQ